MTSHIRVDDRMLRLQVATSAHDKSQMNRLATACLIACCFFSRAATAVDISPTETASDYLIHTWQTERGLPQNWVSSIAQTPDGYLWIGTRYGGLARFDGVRFVPFNQQNVNALKDVQVEHLDVDDAGRLWIMMGNESVTSFRGGNFELVRQPRSEPRVRVDQVVSAQSNAVLFACEYRSLARLHLSASNQWERIDPPPSMDPDSDTFSADRDGAVWFVTLDKRLGHFANNKFELTTKGLPETTVTSLALDSERELWIATPHHLAVWNGKVFVDRTPKNGDALENIVQISFSGDGGLWVLEKNRVRKMLNGQWVAEIKGDQLLEDITSGSFSLHGDAQGNAWLVANGRGLLHCKADGTSHLLTDKNGLPSRFIDCWFQDAEGDVWVGMHGGGIAQIRERLFHVFGPAEGLPDKVVSSVCTDSSNELWAGTMSGELAHWQNGRFVSVPLPAPKNQPNESITVCPRSGGGVWIGSLNNGLLQCTDGKSAQTVEPQWDIRVLFDDRKRQLWVGRLVNLFCFTNGGSEYKSFGSDDGFVDSHAIGALAEDGDGALWIGTGPGELWKYANGKFSRFTPPAEWPAVRFSAVLPDTNGAVWIGTLGGGLLRFYHGRFTRCLKSDGLPDNNVSQLLDSHDGYLWGGTYAGIFRASKTDLDAVADGKVARLPCRVYGEFDGLPSLECSSGFQPSCFRSSDGRLWFSTANGVTSVDPSRTVPNPIAPTVIIEEMLVDGQPVNFPAHIGVPLQAAQSLSSIKISPGRHYVQFLFTGLSFVAPDGVRFRVKLEGGNDQWQSAGAERHIDYGPLAPGNYRFRVTACNSDGVWNDDGDTLAFTVQPYFWETWWFQAGLGLAILTLFAIAATLIQRQRYRRRLEHAERQRAMEHERTRIARDLHDDLGTSLTQIGMLSALANRAETQTDEAKDLVQQVRSRAREMVVALDEIVWAVNPKNDSLTGLIGYLGHFAEEFFRASNIRFRQDIPPQIPSAPVSAESRHHLFLAFKEALNNSVRHSGAAQVQLRVEISATEVVVQVEDNGRGFEASPLTRQGNGLINIKRRLEQIGGRAEIHSVPGKGTTVTLHAPLKNV
ncbi:MAG TPA: two-component regulator propeller domain-containing protein [Verrucomicrobiae bacterium]|jgi:signal transduction histidine kinase/ligand-binding sensor domain-containing protein|nr:two-component regulator propeller domain-containing protein [Verrucomicrobiae bacterium]